jgi:GNAT superfamily N-acetyltransferase
MLAVSQPLQFAIRPYRQEDAEGLRWLFARTPPAGRVYVRPQALHPKLEAVEDNYQAFWVAIEPTREGDALIGILAVTPLDEPDDVEPDFVDRTRPSIRVHWVLVVPERQRRGVGRQLIETVKDWALGNAYKALVLETTTEQEAALDFYRALGFRELGRTTIRRWTQVWFELRIG